MTTTTTKIFHLVPVKGRKSFNGLCHVEETNGIARLYSYLTEVAVFNLSTMELTLYGYYSQTTTSHINAFLVHYGLEQVTSKDLQKIKIHDKV